MTFNLVSRLIWGLLSRLLGSRVLVVLGLAVLAMGSVELLFLVMVHPGLNLTLETPWFLLLLFELLVPWTKTVRGCQSRACVSEMLSSPRMTLLVLVSSTVRSRGVEVELSPAFRMHQVSVSVRRGSP